MDGCVQQGTFETRHAHAHFHQLQDSTLQQPWRHHLDALRQPRRQPLGGRARRAPVRQEERQVQSRERSRRLRKPSHEPAWQVYVDRHRQRSVQGGQRLQAHSEALQPNHQRHGAEHQQSEICLCRQQGIRVGVVQLRRHLPHRRAKGRGAHIQHGGRTREQRRDGHRGVATRPHDFLHEQRTLLLLSRERDVHAFRHGQQLAGDIQLRSVPHQRTILLFRFHRRTGMGHRCANTPRRTVLASVVQRFESGQRAECQLRCSRRGERKTETRRKLFLHPLLRARIHVTARHSFLLLPQGHGDRMERHD